MRVYLHPLNLISWEAALSKIKRTQDNLYPLPKGSVVRTNGSVYFNASNERAISKNGGKTYTSHKKVCIGSVTGISDSSSEGMFYANSNYFHYFKVDERPAPPAKTDCQSIGPKILIERICEKYNLIKLLHEHFIESEIELILDLSTYILFEEKAVFQHYPAWARKHDLFSSEIRCDSFISNFLGDKLTYSKIKCFLSRWARSNISDGNVYLCYDSTNVNSQAEGIFVVQKGFAKDDKRYPQVNTDYIVRQSDGMPVTFMNFPGSIIDISEAPVMISFLSKIIDKFHITLVCDRGYISSDNIELLDKNNIDFLFLVKSNMKIHKDLIRKFGDNVKNTYSYMLEGYDDNFGITVEEKIFEADKPRFFHIIYSSQLEQEHRSKLFSEVRNREKLLKSYANRGKKLSKTDVEYFSKWHDLDVITSGTIEVTSRGRKSKKKYVEAYAINSFKVNDEKIKESINSAGFYLLVSSRKMTAQEARESYSKRDCVEKVFQALKSSLGMYKIGIASDNNLHGKSLLWFIASIFHSVIFNTTQSLRLSDKKNYTTPAIIDEVDALIADKNIDTGKYERRYSLDKRQKKIFELFEISENDIDTYVESL